MGNHQSNLMRHKQIVQKQHLQRQMRWGNTHTKQTSITWTNENYIVLDQEFNCSSLDHGHVKLAEGDVALHISLVGGIMPWVLLCIVSDTFQENSEEKIFRFDKSEFLIITHFQTCQCLHPLQSCPLPPTGQASQQQLRVFPPWSYS